MAFSADFLVGFVMSLDLAAGSGEHVAQTTRSSIRVVKQRVTADQLHDPEEDFLAIEDPLSVSLRIGDESNCEARELVMTMRTPGDDEAMIHGFLFSEGIIQAAGDILGIEFASINPDAAPTKAIVQLRPGLTFLESKAERHFAMHSSCGVCGKVSAEQLALPGSLKLNDRLRIQPDCIHDLPARMREEQDTFQHTGGLHASALFDREGILLTSAEDIGRHNALDKVIGGSLLKPNMMERAEILCVSGRMSYEILQKALVAQIPVIAGVGAPSSLAVAIANDFNVTLLGFVRNGSYNIYSAPQRLNSR